MAREVTEARAAETEAKAAEATAKEKSDKLIKQLEGKLETLQSEKKQADDLVAELQDKIKNKDGTQSNEELDRLQVKLKEAKDQRQKLESENHILTQSGEYVKILLELDLDSKTITHLSDKLNDELKNRANAPKEQKKLVESAVKNANSLKGFAQKHDTTVHDLKSLGRQQTDANVYDRMMAAAGSKQKEDVYKTTDAGEKLEQELKNKTQELADHLLDDAQFASKLEKAGKTMGEGIEVQRVQVREQLKNWRSKYGVNTEVQGGESVFVTLKNRLKTTNVMEQRSLYEHQMRGLSVKELLGLAPESLVTSLKTKYKTLEKLTLKEVLRDTTADVLRTIFDNKRKAVDYVTKGGVKFNYVGEFGGEGDRGNTDGGESLAWNYVMTKDMNSPEGRLVRRAYKTATSSGTAWFSGLLLDPLLDDTTVDRVPPEAMKTNLKEYTSSGNGQKSLESRLETAVARYENYTPDASVGISPVNRRVVLDMLKKNPYLVEGAMLQVAARASSEEYEVDSYVSRKAKSAIKSSVSLLSQALWDTASEEPSGAHAEDYMDETVKMSEVLEAMDGIPPDVRHDIASIKLLETMGALIYGQFTTGAATDANLQEHRENIDTAMKIARGYTKAGNTDQLKNNFKKSDHVNINSLIKTPLMKYLLLGNEDGKYFDYTEKYLPDARMKYGNDPTGTMAATMFSVISNNRIQSELGRSIEAKKNLYINPGDSNWFKAFGEVKKYVM